MSSAFAGPESGRRPQRIKITSVRVRRLKLIKELGSLPVAWKPGETLSFSEGGGSFLEVRTDQGLVGIGPGISPQMAARVEARLVGKDPFDTEQHIDQLRYDGMGGMYSGSANVDIALWDLVGKACGQPIYKLLGGGKDRVTAYASMAKVSTPDERANMAADLAFEGWTAIKLRLHNATMREDIQIVEAVRVKLGDHIQIMVDANQAQAPTDWQPGVLWDVRRALDTARELERLQCAWLEEPLPRSAFDQLAELNRKVEIPIAGGENNRFLYEYLWMLQQGVFDILQPETMVSDGITGLHKISVLTQAYGRQFVPHCALADIGTIAALHLVASSAHSSLLELIHDPPICDYRKRFSIFREPPAVDKKGQIAVPSGPGLGVEINLDLIEK
jgi:L-alanine-DL-glutamate epimerase-like enolase superfamily enzyme